MYKKSCNNQLSVISSWEVIFFYFFLKAPIDHIKCKLYFNSNSSTYFLGGDLEPDLDFLLGGGESDLLGEWRRLRGGGDLVRLRRLDLGGGDLVRLRRRGGGGGGGDLLGLRRRCGGDRVRLRSLCDRIDWQINENPSSTIKVLHFIMFVGIRTQILPWIRILVMLCNHWTKNQLHVVFQPCPLLWYMWLLPVEIQVLKWQLILFSWGSKVVKTLLSCG